MSKALIVTLGGTVEPVVKSINEHSPDMVYFIASQQSVKEIGAALNKLDKKVEYRTKIINDPEDLLEVYSRCEEILKESGDCGVVLVDYTGGTKSMSVGVVLCGIAHGCRFVYVGGDRRDKGGLGIVETGTEHIVHQKSPFDVFAIQEKERGIYLFNCYQFEGAIKEFGDALAKVQSQSTQYLLSGLKSLAEAYLAWDRFEKTYDGIQVDKKLREGIEKLQSITELTEEDYRPQIENIQENRGFFREKIKKELNLEKVVDIFLNAERRGDEGKYDDGVARLYRCMEFIAQFRLKTEYDIETCNMELEKLPVKLRDVYARERDHGGKIQLPLKKAYVLLSELDDEVGRRYFETERERKISNLLQSRNNSILAHGIVPVGKELFEDMRSETRDFLNSVFPGIEALMSKGRFPKF